MRRIGVVIFGFVVSTIMGFLLIGGNSTPARETNQSLNIKAPDAAAAKEKQNATPVIVPFTSALPVASIAPKSPSLKPTVKPTIKATVTPVFKVVKETPIPLDDPPAGEDRVSTDGGADLDCNDFNNHDEAQEYFEENGGSPSNNVDNLDADHDGIACESL